MSLRRVSGAPEKLAGGPYLIRSIVLLPYGLCYREAVLPRTGQLRGVGRGLMWCGRLGELRVEQGEGLS